MSGAETTQTQDKNTTTAQTSPTAQGETGLCKPIPPLIPPQAEAVGETPPPEGIQIQADSAVSEAERITRFSGNVSIEQTGRRMTAEQAEYDHNSGELTTSGKVRYEDEQLQLIGERGVFQLNKDQGEMHNVDYRMLERHASGHADLLRVESAEKMQLYGATYTTCDLDDIDWLFSASELKLDRGTQQGTAKHMVMRFQRVPFFYFPYMRFPIGDERLSGFLFPSFGNSDNNGFEVAIPYYWNIAPNYDATLMPVHMTDRGTRLDTEFRYLGRNQGGKLDVQYLPGDKKANDLNRQYYHWVHQTNPAAGWNAALDYQRVGDPQFFEDFGGGLDSTSLTHLERYGLLSYNHNLWSVNILGQDYQALSGSLPYQRLPQVRFESHLPEHDNRLNYAMTAEWVRFNHDDTSQVTGDRLDLQPSVSLPLQNEALFLIPRLTLKTTHYQLEQQYNGATEHSLTLPVFSLDSGIFLERETSAGGLALLQTLEPRLFYVYAPYRDQSSLPLFDTSLTTTSFSNLFSENRFNGIDRFGDTNHITAALSSRLLRQDSGHELFSVSIGQQFFLDDRQVDLTGNVLQTRNRSNLFAELRFSPDSRWDLRGEWQWDPEKEQTEMGASQLQYRLDRDKMLRLAYRFRRDELETREAGLLWRLNPRWHLFASDKFDLKQEHRLETFYGVQYDSCCWALRLMARNHFTGLVNNQPEFENAIYFELAFKGLSSLGRRQYIDNLLKSAGLE